MQRHTRQPRPRTKKPWTATVLKFDEPQTQTPSSRPTPPTCTLPILLLPEDTPQAVTIEVESRPERRGESWTWTASKRPACQIGQGQPIVLTAGYLRSGIGQILGVAELRRHWITWSIHGGADQCDVRIPTSWCRLEGRDRAHHTRLYRILSPSPGPHPSLASDDTLVTSADSPYEFDSGDDTDPPSSRSIPTTS